jgi:hypothetical protein
MYWQYVLYTESDAAHTSLLASSLFYSTVFSLIT